MMHLVATAPRYDVRPEDYKRFLRYPPARPLEGPMAENASWSEAWYEENGRPWWCGRRIDAFAPQDNGVRLEELEFICPTLAERARKASACFVVAVSAGLEVDEESTRRWQADEPDRYYFLQAWGAAVVASLLEVARLAVAQYQKVGDGRVKFGYAPGYPDWPIADMARLVGLLRRGGELPGQLEVLESGMLNPKKSQVVVFLVES
jgi:hypothetical protein